MGNSVALIQTLTLKVAAHWKELDQTMYRLSSMNSEKMSEGYHKTFDSTGAYESSSSFVRV